MTDPRSTARDSATSARSKTFLPPAVYGSRRYFEEILAERDDVPIVAPSWDQAMETYLRARSIYAAPALPPETRRARIRRLIVADLRRPVVAVVDALAHLAGLPCSSRCDSDQY